MSDSKLLSIVTITYHDAHYLERCVASVYKALDGFLNWEMIIVNNDGEQNIAELPLDFSKLKIVNNPQNGGFGQGNNVGASAAKGKYLLFLNPDTEIIGVSPLQVISELEKHPEIGVLGGRLMTEKNEIQEWSAGTKVTLWDLVKNNLGITSSRRIWESKTKTTADWVAGTAFFTPRSLFTKLSGFDENIFMYFEDVDLCERIASEGKKILYFPNFQVIHKCGGSYIGKGKIKQKKNYYDSLLYYFKKHRSKTEFLVVKTLRHLFFT